MEEVELSWKKEDIFRAADIHFGSLFGSDVYDEIVDHQDLAMPYTLEFAKQTMAIAEKTTAMEGLAIEAEIYAELGLLLDDFDALLCPTNAINGLIAGEDYVDVFPEIRGYRTAGLLRRANDDPVQHYRPLSGSQCPLWRCEQWRSHWRTNSWSQL